MRRFRILTWHIHGSYMYYLSQVPHDFFLPVKPGSYSGRVDGWPPNVHDVPFDDVHALPLDAIVFQTRNNYETDQHETLSAAQRRLPRIYLEHDPPREHPTDTRHPVDDPDVLLVHVTHFNDLMWDNGRTPTRVIEHGVVVPPDVRYTGELARGLVIVNNLQQRGRRLGADLFEYVRRDVPLDLIGMGADELGGLGEVKLPQLPAFAARYRFLFNPIRYTSLGLAVCEAMSVGLPVVGLATTEMATVVENGVTGYVDTNIATLIGHMRRLLDDPAAARRLGENARRYARERFNIERFVRDWDATFKQVIG